MARGIVSSCSCSDERPGFTRLGLYLGQLNLLEEPLLRKI